MMGSCLSSNFITCDMFIPIPFCGKKRYHRNAGDDLNGITFSHYSLTSDTSYLDLYPTFKFMEQDHSCGSVATSGSYQGEHGNWRHSGVPLIDDDADDVFTQQCSHCLLKSHKQCLECFNDSQKILTSKNSSQTNENNGPNTSSIMSADNELLDNLTSSPTMIKGDGGVYGYNSKGHILSHGHCDQERNDLVQDADFRCRNNTSISLSDEVNIKDHSEFHINANDESHFGYINLNHSDNCKDDQNRLRTRRKHFKTRKSTKSESSSQSYIGTNAPHTFLWRQKKLWKPLENILLSSKHT